jgi:predicted short-subunit dehydrogenase-like oxidoreductase (DUF2520 family)
MSRPTRLATAIVGTGHLARALGPLLAERGWPIVAVVGRRPSAARALKRRIPAAMATGSIDRAARDARLLLLAVPDRAVESLAARLAASTPVEWERRVVLHHGGALGLDALGALARAGASVGRLHPLQTLGDPDTVREVLRGSRALVEGDTWAVAVARRLSRVLGLLPLQPENPLDAAGRAGYHAAASMASNDLLALLATAVEVLASVGLSREEAFEALVPLARGTLEQMARRGPRGAWTGPVARGDVATLAGHLDRLARVSPAASELHRLLSLRLLDLARDEKMPLSRQARVRLRRMLEATPGGRGETPGV